MTLSEENLCGFAKTNTIVTWEELSKHSTESDLWVAIDGKAYDLTNWIDKHPGGLQTIRMSAGRDMTDEFEAYHPGYVRNFLPRFYVGEMETKHRKDLPSYQVAHRQLVKTFRDAGMYETDYFFYAKRAALMAVLLAAGVFLALKGHVAPSAVLIAAFWQQAAFIGHDAGHSGITHVRKLDNLIGLVAGNLCNGIGISWWKNTHNVHHIMTNSADHDPDIQHLPVFAISERFFGSLFSKYHSAAMVFDETTKRLVSYQHLYWIPVLCLAKWTLYGQSIFFLCTSKSYVPLMYEALTLAAYFTWVGALALQFSTWAQTAAFVFLSHAAFGVLHLQITCSHWTSETYEGIPEDGEFLKVQLQGTTNWSCPRWLDWFHGGLQFQIEHHCFPRMPRHNLRRVSEILKGVCEEHGLPYRSPTFPQIIMMTYETMRQAALAARKVTEFHEGSGKKFSFVGSVM
uniref:Delta8-fatty-acid desaturase n=1 Tax=Tetraselmis sp. GSL018 TaxID=582737 RepID=A0A061QVR6_9CHLO